MREKGQLAMSLVPIPSEAVRKEKGWDNVFGGYRKGGLREKQG